MHVIHSAVVATLLAVVPAFAFSASPRHARELALAWKAYGRQEYSESLGHLDIVLREFRRQALRDQQAITAKKERVPNGPVTPDQRDKIHANGVLNDVATAFYLRGRCLDGLGKTSEATASFTEATKLPGGRCWDEKGKSFWSPPEAAQLCLTYPDFRYKEPHKDPREIYTALAWSAYNRGAYEKAILLANKCVDPFLKSAQETQAELVKRRAVIGNGVVSGDMKERIHRNGVLNDVATCLYIIGEAAFQLNNRKGAAAAYGQCSRLTYGRCFDPEGPWFWSPAQVSSDRLLDLR
jgi:tetratricopeptide (TPR) repeat protein